MIEKFFFSAWGPNPASYKARQANNLRDDETTPLPPIDYYAHALGVLSRVVTKNPAGDCDGNLNMTLRVTSGMRFSSDTLAALGIKDREKPSSVSLTLIHGQDLDPGFGQLILQGRKSNERVVYHLGHDTCQLTLQELNGDNDWNIAREGNGALPLLELTDLVTALDSHR